MLKQVAEYNDLSPALTKKLEERIKSFGKVVRYRFDIEQENPDKTFYNGKTIFPGIYTLDPTVFDITDNDENRDGKSKFKKIALIKSHESNGTGGFKTEFIKIRVPAQARGILRLELDNPEDIAKCMVLEMHPKLKGGLFSDKNRVQVINRVDENSEAVQATKERSEKRKALNAVEDMTDEELIKLADALGWDSTKALVILRNDAEQLAETDYSFFNELVSGKKIEYQSLVKQALDREIIIFDAGDYKFTWAGNKQVITVLSPVGADTNIEKMAEWLQVGGDKATEVYTKLKGLVNNKKAATA